MRGVLCFPTHEKIRQVQKTSIFIKNPLEIRFEKENDILIPVTFASNIEGLLFQHTDSVLKDLEIINNLSGHFLLLPQTVTVERVQVRDKK